MRRVLKPIDSSEDVTSYMKDLPTFDVEVTCTFNMTVYAEDEDDALVVAENIVEEEGVILSNDYLDHPEIEYMDLIADVTDFDCVG